MNKEKKKPKLKDIVRVYFGDRLDFSMDGDEFRKWHRKNYPSKGKRPKYPL
jgi:hypothetical protein